MTAEDYAKFQANLNAKMQRAFGSDDFQRGVRRANEMIERAATQVQRAVESSGVRAYEERVARTSNQVAQRVADLQTATEKLEAGQRTRVDRILRTAEAHNQALLSSSDQDPYMRLAQPARPRRSPLQRFIDSLTSWWCRHQQASREGVRSPAWHLLAESHHHPEVARRHGSGRRRWYAAWQRAALRVLELGIELPALGKLYRSFAGPARRWFRIRPLQPRDGDFPQLRERLVHSIYPNAPTGARHHRRPIGETGAALLST